MWVWVWVGLRPIDLIISKGCSMAPIPSESALLASLQAGLFHWKTYSCEYSAGTGLTQLVCHRCNCYCQFKELYSECSIFSYNGRVYIITVISSTRQYSLRSKGRHFQNILSNSVNLESPLPEPARSRQIK